MPPSFGEAVVVIMDTHIVDELIYAVDDTNVLDVQYLLIS
jgi:hypothetical protein